MRLIDADKLEKELFNTPLWDNEDEDEFYELINKQPTAYDIDKVVGQLESELYRGMESLEPVRISFNFGINKAIEIVKKGGAV